MEINTTIKVSKEELITMIKEKFGIEGDIEFVVKDELYKNGWCDDVQHYAKRYFFDSVIIKKSKEKS